MKISPPVQVSKNLTEDDTLELGDVYMEAVRAGPLRETAW
jgi:hypothetical protein